MSPRNPATASPDTAAPTALRLAAGWDLEYATRGPDGTAAIVFVHGWPDSWRSFEPVMAALAPDWFCVAVSLRGFGGSDAPDGPYRPEDLAVDVVELLDHLGVTSAVVVGHSLGSVVAQQIAVDRPDLVVGLILVGGFTRLPSSVENEVWAVASALEDPIDETFVREFQAGTLAAPVPPAFFEQLVTESLKAPARVWRAAWNGLRSDDYRELPSRVGAPTLLIWGDRDGLVPRSEQETMLSTFGRADLHVYVDAGHSPNWEQPHRVATDIASWILQTASVQIVDDGR